MTPPAKYAAAYVPRHVDEDDAVDLAVRWLRQQDYAGEFLVACNLVSQASYLPRGLHGAAVVAPRRRSSRYSRGNAVVAIWADGRTRELAESCALDGALCVIEGYDDGVRGWAVRAGARNLSQPDEAASLPELAPEVRSALDFVLSYGGHKNFMGGSEKQQVVRSLRQMVDDGHRPEPDSVRLYAVASGKVQQRGVDRLLDIYLGVLKGRQFRDYARRPI